MAAEAWLDPAGRALTEAIEELRRRNEPVPVPLARPTEAEVDDAAGRAGVALHPDLRRYMLEASDVVAGTLEPVTIGDGHTDLITVVANAREAGVPEDLVPICEDNGDYYAIASDGHVVFWSHDGATDEQWPSLAAWIAEVWLDGA